MPFVQHHLIGHQVRLPHDFRLRCPIRRRLTIGSPFTIHLANKGVLVRGGKFESRGESNSSTLIMAQNRAPVGGVFGVGLNFLGL